MAARPGRTSPTAFPTAASSTWCARIRSGAACCLPARSRPSTCRSTMASTGSRCATTCRRRPIRDLVIKDDDLVVGTHGRSFYILDDITPLRQISAAMRRRRCAPVRAAGGVALPLEQEHRHAAAAGRAGRPESARRRDPALLPEGGRRRPCRSRSSTRRAASCAGTRATIRSNRSSKAATRPTTGCVRIARCRRRAGLHRFVWDMHHERPAVSGFSYPICGDLREHAAHAAWVVGRARQVHRAADRRRQVADAAARREDGSAREGDRRRPEAAVRHVARDRRDAAAHVGGASRDSRRAPKTPQR